MPPKEKLKQQKVWEGKWRKVGRERKIRSLSTVDWLIWERLSKVFVLVLMVGSDTDAGPIIIDWVDDELADGQSAERCRLWLAPLNFLGLFFFKKRFRLTMPISSLLLYVYLGVKKEEEEIVVEILLRLCRTKWVSYIFYGLFVIDTHLSISTEKKRSWTKNLKKKKKTTYILRHSWSATCLLSWPLLNLFSPKTFTYEQIYLLAANLKEKKQMSGTKNNSLPQIHGRLISSFPSFSAQQYNWDTTPTSSPH